MPVQRSLTVAEYIAMTDLYAGGIEYLIDAIGDLVTDASAIGAAVDVRDMVTAFAQPDKAQLTADLINPVIGVIAALGREATLAAFYGQFNSAVLNHLGQDLNAWLADDGARVHHLWKRGGNPNIAAVNTFPPVTVLGTYAVTGSGAGTLTAGAAVATALYGGAQIELEVIDDTVGAADIDVTCTCTTAAGGTVTKTGQIPNGSIVGAKVQLGTAADRIVAVTAVAIEGGTNGDDFQVQTMEDARA